MKKFFGIALLAVTLGCAGGVPGPGQIANAVITCTAATCGGAAANPQCATLETAALGCLTSGGNVAICLAGLPALIAVGYADVVCIVANLATAGESTKAAAADSVQGRARDWLASQRLVVKLVP